MTIANKHPHYHKDVSRLQTVDVYRVLHLFNVTDPCLQHALKKILVAGGRGGGKDITRDVHLTPKRKGWPHDKSSGACCKSSKAIASKWTSNSKARFWSVRSLM